MLPADSRVRRSAEFGDVVRKGRRCGRPALVVHLLATSADSDPRAGVVVGRTVGGAVIRNRVRRRIRAHLAAQLPHVARGTLVVVRALPPSVITSYDEVGNQLASALRKLEGLRA